MRSLVQTVAVAAPALQVDVMTYLAAGQVDERRGRRPARPSRQTQTPLMATSRSSGSKAAARGADRGEHPAPVGVLAVDRALEQVAAGDGPGDLDRVVLGRRADDLDRDVLGRALGVGDQLPGQVGAGLARPPRPAAPRSARRRDAPLASSSTVSLVDMQPSESTRSNVVRAVAARSAPVEQRPASATASVVRTTSIVASPGASMPAPLAMPPTTKPAPLTAHGLGDRVGGHDRRRPRRRRPRRSAAPDGRASTPAQQQVHRQPLADQAGRADRDLAGAAAEQLGDVLGGGVGVLEAGRAGAGVGAAGVEHDGAQPRRPRAPARSTAPGAALTRLPVKTPAAGVLAGRR